MHANGNHMGYEGDPQPPPTQNTPTPLHTHSVNAFSHVNKQFHTQVNFAFFYILAVFFDGDQIPFVSNQLSIDESVHWGVTNG
jgi:hypothetical protein